MDWRVLTALLLAWCACAMAGNWAMFEYETTPADVIAAPATWPISSRWRPDPHRATLLAFFHPRCPCSRASLAELNVLVSGCEDRTTVRIAIVLPKDVDESWGRTALAGMAEQIPGAIVQTDAGGAEATCFGATTSGEVLLFAPDGRLLFQGGVTRSRGHEGDNPGRAALASLIQHGDAAQTRWPVFGCALSN